MNRTRHDLPQELRMRMCDLLNARLADALTLYTHSKQAHWNVRGPNFGDLHRLFDDVASSADEYADLLAERVAALGGQAHGTLQSVAANTALPPYPERIQKWREHTEAMAGSLANFAASVRKAIDTATDAGDLGTADLFTEISRGADKHLWFVEAHLHD